MLNSLTVDGTGSLLITKRVGVGAVTTDGVVPVRGGMQNVLDEDDLRRIGDEFGLGEVQRATYLAEGLMNRNWRVETDNGAYALKLLCDVPADIGSRNALVLTALAACGLPVCPPVRARDGEAVLRIGPRNYLVYPWAEGSHVEGTRLPLTEVKDFGALVATIHLSLNDQARVPLPGVDVRPAAKVTSTQKAIQKADRLLATIAAIAEPSDFDTRAQKLLEQRTILIDRHSSSQPPEGQVRGPVGWTHGDLQYRNILRSGASVTAVLDWDRVGIKAFGEEVARTAQVQFGGEQGQLDLERVAAFVAGYRTVVPLSRADLADAVDRLWWKRLSDYWIFEFHYDRGDHGPDSLMVPSEDLLGWWSDRRDDVEQAFAAGS